MERDPQLLKPPVWRGKPIRRLQVMVKPTGPLCNLNCTYCYYLSKQDLLGTESRWRISEEVLETFIRQYFEGQNYKEVIFSWQGGEPTLLGLDFFRRVVELEKRYCPRHVRVENDLQTNGTLLDEAWCEFLAEHNFLVGLSLDGPKKSMITTGGTRRAGAASTRCSGRPGCSRSTKSTLRS